MSDGRFNVVWKHNTGRNKRLCQCADVLSGGGRDAGLLDDNAGRPSVSEMVLSVFPVPDIVGDIACSLVCCDAGADNKP